MNNQAANSISPRVIDGSYISTGVMRSIATSTLHIVAAIITSTCLADDPFTDGGSKLEAPVGVVVDRSEIPKLILPTVPKVVPDLGSTKTPEAESNDSRRGVSKSSDSQPFVGPKQSELLYARKKSGDCRIVFSSPEDSLVKVVDLQTGRVAAMIWVRGNERKFDLLNLPSSTYGVLCMRGMSVAENGNIVFASLWKISNIDLRDPMAVARIQLSIKSDTPIQPAAPILWDKFKTPKID